MHGSETGAAMRIYPTLEIHDRKCVSLVRGRVDEPTIWHVDPVETARGFAEAGAEWMHVTDIDGLLGGAVNNDLLEEIIRAAGIPVQMGGGFRSREVIETWIGKGAGRVVVSTMAARDPDAVKELAKYHPDQIVLAVDVYQGAMMTEGWRKKGALQPEAFVRAFDAAPLAGIIVTDIDADIEDAEASLEVISGLAAVTPHPVIARGVVRTAADLARLAEIPNISGALIGRALLSRDVDLAEAIEAARPSGPAA